MNRRIRLTAIGIMGALLLSACGDVKIPAQTAVPTAETAQTPEIAQTPETVYEIPPMAAAEFAGTPAVEAGEIQADESGLSQGYIALSAMSQRRLKFQVILGEQTYNYDLPGDGTGTVFPLNMGDGDYTFRVMENVSGDKYTEIWRQTRSVTLESQFAPFLRPSQMADYGEDAQCVALARELAAGCADDAAVVGKIYDWLTQTIVYDEEKAKTVESGYLPHPDGTLSTKKGICFDYAALAAAMLRSVGIPCKIITGYVEPEEIYHAWNSIYLENQGWITYEIQAVANSWKRVDITFSAGGVPAEETDNDALYTTRYTY